LSLLAEVAVVVTLVVAVEQAGSAPEQVFR
jgi:hypothetical protein